jgi:hypothetical protein
LLFHNHRPYTFNAQSAHEWGHRPTKYLIKDPNADVPILDRLAGTTRAVQIFVAVPDFSNYTHAEASPTQSAADWLISFRSRIAALRDRLVGVKGLNRSRGRVASIELGS